MLRGVTKAGALSVKLARESFFGNALMKQCTVHGTRSQPSLPADKLQELKTVVRPVLKYTIVNSKKYGKHVKRLSVVLAANYVIHGRNLHL